MEDPRGRGGAARQNLRRRGKWREMKEKEKEQGRETEIWAAGSRKAKDLKRFSGVNYITVISGNFWP